ncbi:FAD-dependent oxidoreductase [Thalassoglobus sp. JC818]|uniref:FAD-dependent oxidoreductase n=1 Tax=Thalassoglobus sp. JC818 TaxID=3232136 RepID=UPI00345960E4
MSDTKHTKTILLLGVGHTHAHIVRNWKRNPIPQTKLVCVSNFPTTVYSGMLPGVLAGQFPLRAAEIDLQRLCDWAGVELVIGNVTHRSGRQLILADGTTIAFDVLSVGIGSIPSTRGIEIAHPACLSIKPMQDFTKRFGERLDRLRFQNRSEPIKVSIIGGGMAGCEIALCLQARLSQTATEIPFELKLIHDAENILQSEPSRFRRRVSKELKSRNIHLTTGHRVREISIGALHLEDGSTIPNDLAILASGAAPPPLLSQLELPRDDNGFLLTDDSLQSTSGEPVFAVGDSGSIQHKSVPKAGVYAVRQGPILWDNLQRLMDGKTPKKFEPQENFLKLMNFGNRSAAGVWRGFSFQGAWALHLKNWIDRSFVQKYQPSDKS